MAGAATEFVLAPMRGSILIHTDSSAPFWVDKHVPHLLLLLLLLLLLWQMNSADSFHERADAFETVFERSYAAFQLHCRGVRVLRQSLLRQRQSSGCADAEAEAKGEAGGDPRSDPDAWNDDDGDDVGAGGAGGAGAGSAGDVAAASGGVGCGGSTTASDTRVIEGRAETHLLRTLGAELSEAVTARECEKLVSRRHTYLNLSEPAFKHHKAN